MTEQEAREVAKKLQQKLGGYSTRVQPHYFNEVEAEGFLFFLKEPGPRGEDFARVELFDRGDGTWGLYMEPSPFFKRTVEGLGFTLAVDDMAEEAEGIIDSLPVVRRSD